MSLYTLAFREDAGPAETFGPEERLDVAAELMATIGAVDGEALVVLPAGYAVAPSLDEREQWAEGLAAASRNAGVGVVLGLDVEDAVRWGMERCLRSFAYAVDRGRRLLWDAPPTGRGAALSERTVTFGALRTTLLFSRELFTTRSTAAVEAARPDLVVVLGHGGPTRKWLPPLAALDEIAPTLVVHQSLAVRRPVTLAPPRGWRQTVSRGAIRVVSYRREDGATARVVGH